jgi:hypothetical protein
LEHFPEEEKLFDLAPVFNLSTCLDGRTHMNNLRMLGARNYFEEGVWVGCQGLSYSLPPCGAASACAATGPSLAEFDAYFPEMWTHLKVTSALEEEEADVYGDMTKYASVVVFKEKDQLGKNKDHGSSIMDHFAPNGEEDDVFVGTGSWPLYVAGRPGSKVYSAKSYFQAKDPDRLQSVKERVPIEFTLLENWVRNITHTTCATIGTTVIEKKISSTSD